MESFTEIGQNFGCGDENEKVGQRVERHKKRKKKGGGGGKKGQCGIKEGENPKVRKSNECLSENRPERLKRVRELVFVEFSA